MDEFKVSDLGLYETRNGFRERIVLIDTNPANAYYALGESGRRYRSNGAMLGQDATFGFDLVARIPTPDSQDRIVGVEHDENEPCTCELCLPYRAATLKPKGVELDVASAIKGVAECVAKRRGVEGAKSHRFSGDWFRQCEDCGAFAGHEKAGKPCLGEPAPVEDSTILPEWMNRQAGETDQAWRNRLQRFANHFNSLTAEEIAASTANSEWGRKFEAAAIKPEPLTGDQAMMKATYDTAKQIEAERDRWRDECMAAREEREALRVAIRRLQQPIPKSTLERFSDLVSREGVKVEFGRVGGGKWAVELEFPGGAEVCQESTTLQAAIEGALRVVETGVAL